MQGIFLAFIMGCFMVLSWPVMAQQGSVQSELSASTITLDEAVTLSVVAIGVEGELDASALNEKFEVVGRSSSRQISTVIGGDNQPTTTSVNTWTLELMPREAGVFTVPAVSVGGVSSQLLSLTVNEVPAGARRDVFVEATVDIRNPWVQSQVLMTIRVYQGIEIVDGGLSDPGGTDIQVQRIGKDVYSNEVRDGRQYSVTERRFALFPQKSGSLVIDPVILSVSVPTERAQQRGLFSATRKLTRRTDSLTLDVQARPSTGMAWWLPASDVTLESSWVGSDKASASVDQPLTRTITLRGIGVLDSQLPDIQIPAIDGVSLYAEEPLRSMSYDERGLVAEQTIKWALIPQREGQLVLPEVSVEWFDTDAGRVETAVLPEEIISVGPSLNAGGVSPGDNLGGEGAVSNPVGGDEPMPLTSTTDESSKATESAIAQLSPDDSAIIDSDAAAATRLSDSGTASDSESVLSRTGALPARISALQSSVNTWRTLSLILLTLLAGSMAFYWWRSRHHGGAGDAIMSSAVAAGPGRLGAVRRHANAAYRTMAPLAAVEDACQAENPAAVRTALLDWAAQQWPERPPGTLTALAAMLDDELARSLVKVLDASLYSRQGASANSELMSQLRALPERLSKSAASSHRSTSIDTRSRTAKPSNQRGRGLPDL